VGSDLRPPSQPDRSSLTSPARKRSWSPTNLSHTHSAPWRPSGTRGHANLTKKFSPDNSIYCLANSQFTTIPASPLADLPGLKQNKEDPRLHLPFY
jgi:hypothetical protein